MDLLAPCRSCLQCLPFFHVSPPPSPRLTAAPPSLSSPQDVSQATSTDPSHSSEILPCPNAAPSLQEQDLFFPIKAEEKPQATRYDKDEALESSEDAYSTVTEIEAVPVSGILIAPPVSSSLTGAPRPEDLEDNRSTTHSELPLDVPFINDITFSASGFLPLQSPITPAPFGAGYPAGQYPPHNQLYQNQHLGHAHSHHSHYGHENSQHGHDHSHHGHENSQHGHDQSLHSHESSQQEYEAPLPQPPLDDSTFDKLHKDASHHHSHHHSHDSSVVDAAENAVTGHTSVDDDHHDKIDDISLTPHLETSQSTPDVDLEAKVDGEPSIVSHINGASALLETYHSEPVVLSGDPHDDDNEAQNEVLGISESHAAGRRRRRRDHFRDQFKGIKQQIKQGGHHIKEEGSKHMLTIIDNMNKQAQQIEQSGSFFNVPRLNNN